MRGATHAKWAACAVAVALAATACGGGGSDSGGGDGSGVVSSSWGDPQNPLEPANTNEVQGGKVLDMLFRGPEAVQRQDRRGRGHARREDRDHGLAELHDHGQGRLDVQQRRDGHRAVLRRRLELRRQPQEQPEERVLLRLHRRLRQGPPRVGAARAPTPCPGSKVTGTNTFTVKLNQKFSTFPDTLGYAAFSPLPKAFFDDHAAWLEKPVGNGPYTVDSYTKGSQMSLRKWDDYPGEDKAQNGGVDLKVYTDNNTAYTDLMAGNLDLVDDVPASQLKNVRERPRRPVHQHPRRHHPDARLPVLRQELGQERHGEGPHGPVHGDQPRADHRHDLPEDPHPGHRLDLAGPRRGRRLQGRAVRRRLRVRPDRGQEADRGGRRPPRRPGQDHVQRGHRLAQGVGRRRLQLHQQRAGQRQGLRRQPDRHLRRLPQPDHPDEDVGPVPRRLADGLPADPELPAAAVLHQRLVQRRQVVQRGLRQARRRGQRRDRHRPRPSSSSSRPRRSCGTTWPPSRSGTRTAAPATRSGSPNVALNPFSVPVYNEIKVN